MWTPLGSFLFLQFHTTSRRFKGCGWGSSFFQRADYIPTNLTKRSYCTLWSQSIRECEYGVSKNGSDKLKVHFFGKIWKQNQWQIAWFPSYLMVASWIFVILPWSIKMWRSISPNRAPKCGPPRVNSNKNKDRDGSAGALPGGFLGVKLTYMIRSVWNFLY